MSLKERLSALFARAPVEPDPPGVTVPAWLVRAAKFASWVAMFTLVYFLWLYTLDIARDRAGALHLTQAGGWVGELFFYFPYIFGFALVAFGVPYVAKIALPTFMSLRWSETPWAKGWSLFIAVAVSLVVIAGTFTVQGDTLMERDRESAVAVEGVQQEAAVLEARIADKRRELDDMVNNASVYVRTAASMSPEAYDVFVAERRDDWQYDRLRSYRATSVDAQRLRGEIAALRDQQARQTAVASVQAEVVTERTEWVAGLLGWLEGARALLLSFVMDIVALLMPWIALRLEQARNVQLGMSGDVRSGWADDAHQIPDLRAEEPIAAGTYQRETVLQDADTKETIIDKDGDLAVIVREHTRKVKKNGQPVKMAFAPPPPPDEGGVLHDGGGRAGSVAASVALDAVQHQPQPDADHQEAGSLSEADDQEPVHTDLSDSELAAYAETLAADAPIVDLDAPEQNADSAEPDQQSEHVALPNSEGVLIADETDPSKVAAE